MDVAGTAEAPSNLFSRSQIAELGPADLVLSTHNLRGGNGEPDLGIPLAVTMGLNLQTDHDVCCFSPRRISRDERDWRVITTHGSSTVKNGIVRIDCKAHCVAETNLLSRLRETRAGLLESAHVFSSGMKPASGIKFPFADMRGKVLIAGDFSEIHPSVLLALQGLFLVSNVREAMFVTSSIPRPYLDFLQVKGVQVTPAAVT